MVPSTTVTGVLVLLHIGLVHAAVDSDEVLSFPGVPGPLPSRMYSGYLQASVRDQTFFSHYTFTVSQSNPGLDPVVLWQQGSGSSFGIGYLTEVGPFRVDGAALAQNSTLPVASRNPYSWDRVSNLLLLEHPPGVGFSYCIDSHGERAACSWDDATQAEAFFAVLQVFYASFHEFATNEFFIVGESYAGLFVPYAVQELMLHPDSIPAKQLKAFAIGNGCTGTVGASPEKRGSCNGPYGPMGAPIGKCGAAEHVVRFLGTHAALSTEQQIQVNDACGFPCRPKSWGDVCVPGGNFSSLCEKLLLEAQQAVGDFYEYNFYDTCGNGNQVRNTVGLHAGDVMGGQTYPCGTGKAVEVFCNNDEVRSALHLKPVSFYGRPWNERAFGNDDSMLYATFSGDSYSLYPKLLSKYSVVIYNGDFDLCVPWSQNEEWTSLLAKEEGYQRVLQWRSWPDGRDPSGYVTSYAASPTTHFTFATVKGAGHMVPMYQPKRAFDFFQRFLQGHGLLAEAAAMEVITV